MHQSLYQQRRTNNQQPNLNKYDGCTCVRTDIVYTYIHTYTVLHICANIICQFCMLLYIDRAFIYKKANDQNTLYTYLHTYIHTYMYAELGDLAEDTDYSTIAETHLHSFNPILTENLYSNYIHTTYICTYMTENLYSYIHTYIHTYCDFFLHRHQ